jgi:hypothetical protein
MGFFKKIFKGIKKIVKKIGKGIKSAFKSIGKFMGKIGIIGQIGLALILPGVGQMLSGLLVGTTPGVVGGLAGTLQGMGAVGQAASNFIQGAVKIASNTSQFFSSVTDGVTKVVGDTIGAAAKSLGITTDSFIGQGLNRIGINVDESGWGKIFTNAEKSFGNITEAGRSIFDISNPVGDPTATTLAQDQMGNISQASEGLQGQIEGGMTTPDIPAPVVEQPSLLTPEMPRPVVTTTTSAPPTVLESIQAGSYTTDATGTIVPKASLQPEKSLLDKTSEFITGKSFDENLASGRVKIREAVTDFIPETGKALGREAIAQVTGLSPTAEQLRPIAYSSSVALGDFETSIGLNDYATSPYQSVIDQVGPQYAMSHPYGLMAQQFNFNQYQEQARARGVAA